MGYGAYSPMGYGISAYGYYGAMGFGMSPWIGFGYYSPMTFWNSYYTWNGFYNPYYGGMIVTNPKIGTGSVTRLNTFNPSSYTNYAANRGNLKPSSSAYTPYNYSQTIRRNYSANSFNSQGNTRQLYNRPNTINSNSTLSNQSRSYTPHTSSFGGSGGGGGMSRGGGGGGIGRGR